MANLPQSAHTSGTAEIDSVLHQIVESAQTLSGATGAAIAIRNGSDRNGEEILCVARSGETAPPLGSRLEANSGISGECLLSGRVLHCDDTTDDHRVDPEVCHQLGLRSIIVLPVRGRTRTAGVLEVFSTRPHAFTGEHIDSLKRLTEMVEMACASKSVDGAADLGRQGPQPEPTETLLPPVRQKDSGLPFPLSFLKDKRSYWIAGGGLAMLILVTLVGVAAFQSSGNNGRPNQASQSTAKPSPPETAEILLQGSAGNADRQINRGRHATKNETDPRGLQKASKVEVFTGNGDSTPQNSGSLRVSPAVENHAETSSGDIESNQAPSLPLTARSVAPEDLLLPSATMPKLSPAISQGVTGGVLDHRVDPTYPPGALAMRLEGEVVLAAVITKTGQVRDLKVVRGSPVLARAAMDAVKQWHYQPYRLNGEPLESQTEIRVQFHTR